MSAVLVHDIVTLMSINKCRSCGADIVWAKTEKEKTMPVDVRRSERGKLILYSEVFAGTDETVGPYRIRTATPAESDFLHGNLWLSHFATCTNATFHRKGGDL